MFTSPTAGEAGQVVLSSVVECHIAALPNVAPTASTVRPVNAQRLAARPVSHHSRAMDCMAAASIGVNQKPLAFAAKV